MTVCPTQQCLDQLLNGGLDEPMLETVAEHVANCSHCQDVLDQLSDDEELNGFRIGAASTLHAEETGPGLVMLLRRAAPGAGPISRVRPLLAPPIREGDLGCLGPYFVEAELGCGGMGVVYRAWDADLRRAVAIKALLPALGEDRNARARFVLEAQSAARVKHDNIVDVHRVVQPDDGLPFMVMEFVAGETLAQQAGTRQLQPREAAERIAEAAAGVQAAHDAGLIHRDIKPSNIIVDSATERARLMDFGLARWALQSTGLTEAGALTGTPAYMSPEQVAGREDLDARTDVYSLGATLYELLTGAPPFRGATSMVLRQVLAEEPRPPRQLNDAVPRDLETICLKALAKEPRRRYPTAAALADDLRRFSRGESIQARPAGRIEKIRRWRRRNPGIAALSLAIAVIFLAGLASTSWQAWRASANAARADSDRRLAEQRRDDAEQSQREALAAVDAFFTQVSEEQLLRQPQLQSLRRNLLEKAFRHYQEFLKSQGDNPRLSVETALAAFRLANIIGEIGSRDDAESAFAETIARLDHAIGLEPNNQFLQLKRVDAYRQQSGVLEQREKIPEAIESLQKTAALCKEMLERDPENIDLRHNLLACYGNIANLHVNRKEHQLAVPYYENLQWELEALVRAQPGNPGLLRTLGLNCHNLAMAYSALRQEAKALAVFNLAHQIRRDLVAWAPDNEVYLRDLARTRILLSPMLRHIGKSQEALELFESGVAGLETLVERFPAKLEYRQNLASACLNLGSFLGEEKMHERSLRLYEKGRVQEREILKVDPQSASVLDELAMNLLSAGRVLLAQNRPGDALPFLQEAIALKSQRIQSVDGHALMAEIYRNVAAVFHALEKHGEALASYEQAIQHARQALEKAPNDMECRQRLSVALQEFASRLRERKLSLRAADLTLERSKLWPDRASELFASGCELALVVALEPAGPRRWVDDSVGLLQQAVSLDAKLRSALVSRNELAVLRGEPGFERLVREASGQGRK